eukprot:13880593-Heterocapsa_arctica.AAC.1
MSPLAGHTYEHCDSVAFVKDERAACARKLGLKAGRFSRMRPPSTLCAASPVAHSVQVAEPASRCSQSAVA